MMGLIFFFKNQRFSVFEMLAEQLQSLLRLFDAN